MKHLIARACERKDIVGHFSWALIQAGRTVAPPRLAKISHGVRNTGLLIRPVLILDNLGAI